MRTNLIRIALFWVAVLFGSTQSDAANVSITESKISVRTYGERCLVAHVSLQGEIVQGDAEKLRNAFKEIGQKAAAASSVCYINDGVAQQLILLSFESQGGLYSEGWKIAKLISSPDTLAATYLGKGGLCYSACAIAFLGGSTPGAEGGIIRRRVMHPTAKLGFHAPFPVLKERSYTSEDIMSFFLSAFVVANEFLKDAKSLGIEPEVAHMMLQPTPDDFFDIDSVGRALLAGINVSDREFTFSVYGSSRRKLLNQDIVNLCINNTILKEKGNASSPSGFQKQREGKRYLSVKIRTSYFTPEEIPGVAYVVPVADAGEGFVTSCIAVAAKLPKTEYEEGGFRFWCLGFSNGLEEVTQKISREGTDWIWRDSPDAGCARALNVLALSPWERKLVDVPREYLDD